MACIICWNDNNKPLTATVCCKQAICDTCLARLRMKPCPYCRAHRVDEDLLDRVLSHDHSLIQELYENNILDDQLVNTIVENVLEHTRTPCYTILSQLAELGYDEFRIDYARIDTYSFQTLAFMSCFDAALLILPTPHFEPISFVEEEDEDQEACLAYWNEATNMTKFRLAARHPNFVRDFIDVNFNLCESPCDGDEDELPCDSECACLILEDRFFYELEDDCAEVFEAFHTMF